MTRGIKQVGLKEEAIRLRVDGRKSLKEIQAELGVSMGSLSPWLKPYPLTQEEIDSRNLGKNQSRTGTSLKRTLELRGEPSKFWLASRSLTPHQMAHLGEAAIQLRLVLHGFRSFKSSFEGDRVDFIILVESRVIRVQVKCVVSGNAQGVPSIPLRRVLGHSKMVRYTSEEIDFIVGYWVYSDTAYVYSLSELGQGTSKSISVDGTERWDKLRM